MKNFLKLLKRYIITIFVTLSLLIIACFFAFNAENTDMRIDLALPTIIIAAIPVAISIAVMMSAFVLNKIVKSRIQGFLYLFILNCIVFACATYFAKILQLKLAEDINFLIPTIRTIVNWHFSILNGNFLTTIVSILAFSFYISSFWGFTRISGKRPVIGAFAAPVSVLASLYLFSLYCGGAFLSIIQGLVSKTNFHIENYITAILAVLSGFAVFFIDILFCSKPGRGSIYGR